MLFNIIIHLNLDIVTKMCSFSLTVHVHISLVKFVFVKLDVSTIHPIHHSICIVYFVQPCFRLFISTI